MELLKRKIDDYLISWKENAERMPLIVKGARQIGKTVSIEKFANKNIGFNGKFYTFPYFLAFLLKRFMKEKSEILIS